MNRAAIFKTGAVIALAFFIMNYGNKTELANGEVIIEGRVAAAGAQTGTTPAVRDTRPADVKETPPADKETRPERETRPANNGISPIVDLTAGCLLGGAANRNFMEAGRAALMIKGGERYRFYTLKGPASERAGSKPKSAGAPCEETFEVAFASSPEKEGIAVAGQWNAMPRIPLASSTTGKIYLDVVAGILKKNGIANPKVNITQVLRIDLEGDEVEEVLVSATNYAGGLGPDSKAGDYSLVFLRKLVGGKVENIIIREEYYPQAKKFNAPNEYKVSGVADLNGDGIMEIIVFGSYYEGHWSKVYRLNGSRLEEALTCGCGA